MRRQIRLKEVALQILKVGDSFCKREVVSSAADQQQLVEVFY